MKLIDGMIVTLLIIMAAAVATGQARFNKAQTPPAVLELTGDIDSYTVSYIQEYLDGKINIGTLESLIRSRRVDSTSELGIRYYVYGKDAEKP